MELLGFVGIIALVLLFLKRKGGAGATPAVYTATAAWPGGPDQAEAYATGYNAAYADLGVTGFAGTDYGVPDAVAGYDPDNPARDANGIELPIKSARNYPVQD